jgi:polar amino acid transport system substrate-binding protein
VDLGVEGVPQPPVGAAEGEPAAVDPAATALTARQVARGSARVEAVEPFAPVVGGRRRIDGGGFAFRRTDRGLRDAFNTEIHRMKESGELFRVMRRFGFTRAEMTALTAEELCR